MDENREENGVRWFDNGIKSHANDIARLSIRIRRMQGNYPFDVRRKAERLLHLYHGEFEAACDFLLVAELLHPSVLAAILRVL